MPRKPSQQRSKAMVEAIIEAGFVCVSRYGYSDTTTRHIADLAGVSVGSLYEYFRDKHDVFAAMNRKFAHDIVTSLRELVPDAMQRDVRGAILLLLKRIGELFRRDNGRYLPVARQVLRNDTPQQIERVNKAVMELMIQYLSGHPEYTRLENIPTMAYILVNAATFVVLRQLSEEHPPVTYEQVSEGLADLVSHYIAGALAPVG